MSFWFGYQMKNFLFPEFDIESRIGLITTCIVATISVIVFESLKAKRVMKKLKFNTTDGRSFIRFAFCNSIEKSNLIERPEHARELWRLDDIFFHFFELVIGYLLMMMAMTFNAYIMISIGVGATVAYVIMGTAIMNITVQVVAQKVCMGCHDEAARYLEMLLGGQCTPVAELLNEGASTSSDLHTSGNKDKKESTTIIQIHDSTCHKL